MSDKARSGHLMLLYVGQWPSPILLWG